MPKEIRTRRLQTWLRRPTCKSLDSRLRGNDVALEKLACWLQTSAQQSNPYLSKN